MRAVSDSGGWQLTLGSARQQPNGWIGACATFVALGILVLVGAAMLGPVEPASTSDAVQGAGTAEAPAEPFSPAEQRLVGLLPPGYAAKSCTRASDAFPHAAASLDCTQDQNSDSRDYARFTLYDDAGTLANDFESTVAGMTVTQCPDGNLSPGIWNYESTPGQTGGRIVCGSVEDRADIAWTRDAQLLLATINGGPDLGTLYEWWRRYGGSTER